MSSNIVHQYFKKEVEGTKIIVKVNTIQLKGTELTITPKGKASPGTSNLTKPSSMI
jgi:hypothetical protein